MNQEDKNLLKKQIRSRVLRPAMDEDFRAYYRLYAEYKAERTKALAVAAAIVNNATQYILKEKVDTKKYWFFDILGELIEAEGIKYLPAHPRKLRPKILQFLGEESMVEVVTLPRERNQNRAIEGGEELQAWLLHLRNSPKNFTNAYIKRKIQTQCELNGKKMPSDAWFNERLASKEVQYLTADGRFGKKGRLGNKYRGYNLIAKPLFAGDAWQIDGTRANLIDFPLKDGKRVFLYMIAVRDVHSGVCLGATFSLTEDGLNVIDALRKAANNAGYLPYEIIHDRFPGHNAQAWLETSKRLNRMGVKLTQTSTATGKAQQERWFGTLQTVFMQQSDYYYGEGIQSRRLYALRCC